MIGLNLGRDKCYVFWVDRALDRNVPPLKLRDIFVRKKGKWVLGHILFS